jgi:hypothetical protein
LLSFGRDLRLPDQPLHYRLATIDLDDHRINLLAVIGDAAVGGVVAVPADGGVEGVELRQIDGSDTAGDTVDQQPYPTLPLPVWRRDCSRIEELEIDTNEFSSRFPSGCER